MYFRLCYQKITIFYNWGEMSQGETSLGEKRHGEKCRGEKRLLGRNVAWGEMSREETTFGEKRRIAPLMFSHVPLSFIFRF